MAVGRISGPLLKANLLRQGVDLAFETDLLYLDVKNLRIGVKTKNPTHDLHVNGSLRSTNLEVTDTAVIGQLTVETNNISSSNTQLNLLPAGGEAVVYQTKLVVDSLDIENNTISANSSNTDLVIEAGAGGEVQIFSDTRIEGDLHATGNISADGSIILGDTDTDNITFNADVASNIIPNVTDTYNLGSADKRWNNLHVQNVFTDAIEIAGELILEGVDLNSRPGNTLYVGVNGSDSSTGTHQNDPFLTLKHALSQATSGTTIIIYAGTYTEVFPLTVPSGISIKGTGIRSVTIQPTVATIDKDAFLLNGETTIEDLTIRGYRYNAVDNTGYAFKFANNMRVLTRSPYIKNITVLTEGSVVSGADPRGFLTGDAGKGAYFDGSVVNVNSNEASCLFHSVTFICPGVDVITATNGVRIEWLNSFTYFANRGLYGVSGSTGFAGQGKTELRLSEVTGTFNVGDTVTYYANDGVTVLGSGVIAKKDSDDKIYLTGKISGLETADSRGSKTIQAFGNAKLSTTEKKFGSASLSLDGTGDYAFVQSNNDFAFGTGDFTIEGWFYKETTGVAVSLFDFRTAATQTAPWLYIGAGGGLLYVVNSSNRISTGGGTIGAGSWFHIALSRSGTDTKLFVNGTQAGSTYTDTNNYIQSPLTIGARYTGANEFFNGYIDDVRISKGVARYINNFTAPISVLANDNFTVLLSRFDGDNNSTTFVDESVLIQDVRSSSGGSAKKIDLIDYSDFGVEVRSIGSANVYGNFGAVGDGLGVIMYLIGQNMAYIGSGLRSDNDNAYIIQANEVVENNGAKIYYSTVDQKGDFRVGDLFYVNQETGAITFTTATFNIQSDQGLIFTNGSNITFIDGNKLETGNLRLSGNTLESMTGDVNIQSASDQINLLSNTTIEGNLNVVGNVTIGGNIIIGDEITDSINFVGGISSNLTPDLDNTYDLGESSSKWKDVYLYKVNAGQVEIQDNQITTVNDNVDLEFVSNGTGVISIEDYTFKNNEIKSLANADIIIEPNGTGLVQINSNTSLRIPVGTESERPTTPQNGMIRFNTTANRYEGYNGTVWTFLDGISDVDGDTYVTAEATPGADDDTLRFYANGVKVVEITETGLDAIKVTIDDLEITGNTITNTNVSNSLNIQATGGVVINDLTINGNTISNNIVNGITTFTTLNSGYFRIPGTSGVVIPTGTSAQRPSVAVAGMIRFDTINNRVEVYDGAIWVSAAGSAVGITKVEAENIALGIALVLG
jgi:phage protein U